MLSSYKKKFDQGNCVIKIKSGMLIPAIFGTMLVALLFHLWSNRAYFSIGGLVLIAAMYLLVLGYGIDLTTFSYVLNKDGITRYHFLGKKFFPWAAFPDIYIIRQAYQRGKSMQTVETVTFATVLRLPRKRPQTGGYLFQNNRYISFCLDSDRYPLADIDRVGRYMHRDDLEFFIQECHLRVYTVDLRT